jgi:hypothetical protein
MMEGGWNTVGIPWEYRVYTVQSCSGDAAEQGAAFVFDCRAYEVINIYIDAVGRTVRLAAFRCFRGLHIFFKTVGR